MKNKADVVHRSLRLIGVVAMDEAATADQDAVAVEALDGMLGRLPGEYGVFINDGDEFNDEVFLALSNYLAAIIAPMFRVQSPVSEARALTNLRAVTNPNDYSSSADSGESAYF